jgi:hypothetical protein
MTAKRDSACVVRMTQSAEYAQLANVSIARMGVRR